MELVKILFGQRLEAIQHSLLVDRLQGMITTDATMKGDEAFCQVEALHYFT